MGYRRITPWGYIEHFNSEGLRHNKNGPAVRYPTKPEIFNEYWVNGRKVKSLGQVLPLEKHFWAL